ncbi:efflux RND transporter periplasmic adaptor subunit [Dongshaea marina]|uniref:efflux RND transporter periplasmic adaptor subunit n=1 Tax=Dongshaea marina TaxID=2047966 RepID=UPI000D3ED38B|nr:efflux RND transporter periplasmic adaptor subunit [Dongshaea marina]
MTDERKKMMKPNKISQIAIAFLFSGFINSSFAAQAAPTQTAVTVAVTPTHLRQIPETASSLGTIKAVHSADLSFSSSGHINHIFFQDGEQIHQGDVIATLDDSDVKADIASAQANLDEVSSNYKRYQLLKGTGVFAKQDYIKVQTSLTVAKANYAAALESAHNLKLVAPFDGTLGSFDFSTGAYIGSGTKLVNLVQLDPLKVSYNLNQDLKNRVKLGQAIYLTTDMYPNKKFDGRVTYISPTINPDTGRFDLQAQFGNATHQLSPGQTVTVHQLLGKGSKQLVIPQTAIMVDDQQSYVFTIKDHKAVKTDVITEENTNDGDIVITQGLSEGQDVVTSGTQKLSDSMPVNIQSSAETAPEKPVTPKTISASTPQQKQPSQTAAPKASEVPGAKKPVKAQATAEPKPPLASTSSKPAQVSSSKPTATVSDSTPDTATH